MTGRLGTGRFGLGSKLTASAEPPKPQIKITDQTMLDDLPDEIRDKFLTAFDSLALEKTSYSNLITAVTEMKEGKKKDGKDVKDAKDKSIQIEETIVNQKKSAEKDLLLGELLSTARMIDEGKSIISNLQNELDTAKSDIENSSHARSIPTPFIVRYVQRIEQSASELSENLASAESKLQPSSNFSSTSTMTSFLTEQYDAVQRASTRVAELEAQLSEVRQLVISKMKIPPSQLVILEELEANDKESTTAATVKTNYDLFLSDQKKNLEKRGDVTNLFGISYAKPVAQKTGFLAGRTGLLGKKTQDSK